MTYKAIIRKIVMKRKKDGLLYLKIHFSTLDEKKRYVWKYCDAYLKWQKELEFVEKITNSKGLEELLSSEVRIITEGNKIRAIGDRSDDEKFIYINNEDMPVELNKSEIEDSLKQNRMAENIRKDFEED